MNRRSVLGAIAGGVAVGLSGCVGQLEERCEKIHTLTTKIFVEETIEFPQTDTWTEEFPVEDGLELYVELDSPSQFEIKLVGASGDTLLHKTDSTIREQIQTSELGVATISVTPEEPQQEVYTKLFTRVRTEHPYCGPEDHFADPK